MINETFRKEFKETFWQLWTIFFAHHETDRLDRCYRIRIRNASFHICARCSGIFLGACLSIYALNFVLFNAPQIIVEGLVILFPIPAIADWLTQVSGRRESFNKLRFYSGLMLGSSIGSLAVIQNPVFSLTVVITFGSIIGAILILLRKRICIGARKAPFVGVFPPSAEVKLQRGRG
jgi:uncharacterized membrane protein